MDVASELCKRARTASPVEEARFDHICVRIVVESLWQGVKVQIPLLRCPVRRIGSFEFKKLSPIAAAGLIRLNMIIVVYPV